ncbi:hypothetical protein ACVGOW_19245 [Pseudonocardia saturnea]
MSPTPPVAVRETHVGIVFLVGDRAYKMKKPVHNDFLDFRTPNHRRAACRREIELNRRLAPDVYLGISEVPRPAEPWGQPIAHAGPAEPPSPSCKRPRPPSSTRTWSRRWVGCRPGSSTAALPCSPIGSPTTASSTATAT